MENKSKINKWGECLFGTQESYMWYLKKFHFHVILMVSAQWLHVTTTVPWVIKFHSDKSAYSLIVWNYNFVLESVANKGNYIIIKLVTGLFQILPNRMKLKKYIVFLYHLITFKIIWWKSTSLEQILHDAYSI